MKRLNRKCGVVPLHQDLSLPGGAGFHVWCPHPQPFSTPCREKASWALSFHLCQPPPAPLLNEGHCKRCFSLPSSQRSLLQGLDLLRAVCPALPPLSGPQQVGGASCFRTVAFSIYPNTPLLPVERSSRQHCPPPSSVSAGPSPSVG